MHIMTIAIDRSYIMSFLYDHYIAGSSAKLFLDSDLQNCFLLNPVIGKKMADQVLRDIKFLQGKITPSSLNSTTVMTLLPLLLLLLLCLLRLQSDGL